MKKTLKKFVVACLSAFMLVSISLTGVGCGGDSNAGVGRYTYNAVYQGVPAKWNPHTWESNSDSIILGYITMGLYDVALNDAKDGYKFVPEMAAAEPVDVTADYVGKYGVKDGDSGKAWKIALNQAAVWENGVKINADTYVYSMKELLNPKMFNRRADSYTTGTFQIFGASDYLYSATPNVYNGVVTAYGSNAEAEAAGADLYIDMYEFYGAKGAKKVVTYDLEAGTFELDETVTIEQWVSIKDETTYLDPGYYDKTSQVYNKLADSLFSAADVWNAYKNTYLEVGQANAKYVGIRVSNNKVGYAFDGDGTGNGGVGVLKTGEYEIVLFLTHEVTLFDVHYNLGSNWIVYKDLYEKSKTEEDDLIGSSYFTTRNNTISYGPYKLDKFNAKQYFSLSRNDKWYGYTDGKHEGQFQTTNIDYSFVEGETAREVTKSKFFNGEIDDLSLMATEMADYGTSKYLVCEPESYTFQFFLGTNLDKLKEKDTATENHSVLSLPSFRKAISYTMDRAAYCNEFRPAAKPGFGVLNEMYVIDPDTGETYRSTDEAKTVSLKYSGFTLVDGKWTSRTGEVYEDIDAAYESLTGYDPNYAAELFAQAYKEAKEAGIYNDNQDVVIYFESQTGASDTFKAMVAKFDKWVREAMALKPELPKFKSVSMKLNEAYETEEAYWGALVGGRMDLSFSAWGGSAFDPFGVIYSCYIDPNNTNNYGFDAMAKTINVSVEVKAGDVNTGFVGTVDTTLYDLASWLGNNQDNKYYTSAANNLYVKFGAVGKASRDVKVRAMAVCELAQLETVVNIPVFYSYINSLHSAKYNNGTDEYLQLIGFGGIRYVTYNFDDHDWKAFVKSQGGNLKEYYKAN